MPNNDYTVVATGPEPPSRAATTGAALGQGFGIGVGSVFGQNIKNRRLARDLNPMRAALAQNIPYGGPMANPQNAEAFAQLSPQQQMIAAAVRDPKAFARLAGTPQGALVLGAAFENRVQPYTVKQMIDGSSELGLRLGLNPNERTMVEFNYDENNRLIGAPSLANAPPESPNLQRVSAVVQGEQQPTTLMFDPQAGTFVRTHADGRREQVPSASVTEVSLQGGRDQVLPPARADDIVAQRDWLEFQASELTNMIASIEQDATLAGAGGSLRRLGQQVIGSAVSIADVLGQANSQRASKFMLDTVRAAQADLDAGRVDESVFNSLFNDPNISEMTLFENTLAYTLARLRVPEGRLLASVINDSKRDASLTGFTGSADVMNRLRSIQRQLAARMDSLDRRLGGAPTPLPDSPGGGSTSNLPPPNTPMPLSIEELLEKYAPRE
jgi:hypothetical protein